ncbi:hypothetical protein KCP74_15260 [Salmonella enterica subsp. enterica]|nr:hypothetical protein KCP74_15260 [Salmonella enterica subsp. enterica]
MDVQGWRNRITDRQRAFRLPIRPTANSDARYTNDNKNTLAACLCRGEIPGRQSRRRVRVAC